MQVFDLIQYYSVSIVLLVVTHQDQSDGFELKFRVLKPSDFIADWTQRTEIRIMWIKMLNFGPDKWSAQRYLDSKPHSVAQSDCLLLQGFVVTSMFGHRNLPPLHRMRNDTLSGFELQTVGFNFTGSSAMGPLKLRGSLHKS